jgi:hypothetical protein
VPGLTAIRKYSAPPYWGGPAPPKRQYCGYPLTTDARNALNRRGEFSRYGDIFLVAAMDLRTNRGRSFDSGLPISTTVIFVTFHRRNRC